MHLMRYNAKSVVSILLFIITVHLKFKLLFILICLHNVIFFNVCVFFRRKTAIDDIAVRPITQFPVSLAEEVIIFYFSFN